MIDASRVHPVFFHFEGVIDEAIRVTKGYQTGRDGGLILRGCQKIEWVICASDQINESIFDATRTLPVGMIHEGSTFRAYGLWKPLTKLLIIEAADAHLVQFLGQAVVHFKDLEVGGALCDLHAV